MRMSISPRRIRPVVLLMVLLLSATGQAYESGSTHPGISGRAVLASNLHRFLRSAGLELGLFGDLGVDPSAMPPRRVAELRRDLDRLDPAAGLRPNGLTQWAVGWVMAGSAMQGLLEAAERHHFLDPTTGKGLADQVAGVTGAYRLMSVFEGTDSFRSMATGTASDLTGMPALRWIRSHSNAHSLDELYSQLDQSVTAATPQRRRHHLVLALIALGGLLHVLQDMGSPSHVRNDFAVGHMQRVGRHPVDRASSYERFVSITYGHAGIPAYRGQPIIRPSIDAYFHSPRWNGLADLAHAARFSPGNLPATTRVFANTNVLELTKQLNAKLRYAAPRVDPSIDLDCARWRKCHLKRADGTPLVAYRVWGDGRLVFQLDRHCEAAAAHQLLPLAVGFSTGLLNHLLRGKATLRWHGDEAISVSLSGVRSRNTAVVRLFVEDDHGVRRQVAKGPIKASTAAATVPVPAKTARSGNRLVALVSGRDAHNDRFSCSAVLAGKPAAASQAASP